MKSQNVITLDRGNYTTCTVHLHGGFVTSWRLNNKEQIFVSKLSLFNEQNIIRGGIGLTFPKSGQWEFGPQYGFSRFVQWSVDQMPKKLLTDDIEATFILEDNEWTRSMWNFRFKLINKITLKLNELQFEISVINASPHFPMNFEMMVHTHIKVPDVTKCEVVGLEGSQYKEIAFENPEKFTQKKSTVCFTEYINRCYENTPDDVSVTNVCQNKILRLYKKNFPDLIVWNPWEQNIKSLQYFDPSEFTKVVTVEALNATNPVHLEPGEEFKAVVELEICDP